MKGFLWRATTCAAISFCAVPAWCQTSSDAGPAVQVVVTAEAHKGASLPAITMNDVTVRSGKESLQVLDWIPAQGDHSALQLYLLMDDSSGTSLGTQLSDLKQFITALPPNVAIAIGYMRDGTAQPVQDMTADHAMAASKLRLPMGQAGANGSPFFSITDVIKHWPAATEPVTAVRREMLVVTDGVDRYYGGGPDDPYVADTIRDAQRAGVVVSAIYWSGVGHYGHSFFRINWGQNYLGQISDETGGEFYWQGFGNPVSFAPYLEDFRNRLDHQYLLVFRGKPEKKAGAERIKVQTELPGVDLVTASSAWMPAR